MDSVVVGIVSLVVSIAAVTVAVWNIQRNRRTALDSSTLPVVAAMFAEYRSAEFRARAADVVEFANSGSPTDQGIDSVPAEYRDSILTVCYFFDYLGVIVAFELAHKDIIIAPMCTQIIRVWTALEPVIKSERAYRKANYPPDASPGFLQYFEFLVRLVRDSGGSDAAMRVNRQLKYGSYFN